MKLARPARRQLSEPVIVLVDVVFFLLVFFMLVSRMDATAPFEVMPPVAVTGSDMPGGGVTVAVSRDGALAVDGRPEPDEAWLDAARAAAGGAGALADGEALIRVNAHAGAELRHVLPVVAALEREALGRVVLVVTPGGG
ncbi:MAG: biopolymer transporter ExbD [Pseudomonadota bacterium]